MVNSVEELAKKLFELSQDDYAELSNTLRSKYGLNFMLYETEKVYSNEVTSYEVWAR